MTVIEGSVGDIGMKPLSGTLVARPVTMRRQDNMVITTELAEFEIVAGQLVDVDMVPGPAVVTLEVGSDIRRNFRVTVPADGPVQLADLLEDAYEYTPEVVSVVAGYRNDAYAARQRAIDAADAADRSAGDAAGSAAAAARSAGDAADEAGDAAEFRRLAGLSADAAAGSAGTAGGHASAAAESKRLAEVAHQNTVDSLAGLTGRVKVTEERLPTKADLIGGRIDPAQLIGSGVSGSGIRVDTTVGTRVFVGGTMIYGDTGIRYITGQPNDSGYAVVNHVSLQRIGGTVTASIEIYLDPGFKSGDVAFTFPSGFRPARQIYFGKSYGAGLDSYTPGPSGHVYVYLTPTSRAWYRIPMSFSTKDPWPAVLPAVPG